VERTTAAKSATAWYRDHPRQPPPPGVIVEECAHTEALALSQANRQIYAETRGLLITLNTFDIAPLMRLNCPHDSDPYTRSWQCHVNRAHGMLLHMGKDQRAAIQTIQVSIRSMEDIGREILAMRDGIFFVWPHRPDATRTTWTAYEQKHNLNKPWCRHIQGDPIRVLWEMEALRRVLVDYRSDLGLEYYDLDVVAEGVRFCTGKPNVEIVYWDRLEDA
jgi:hypothetical protein